VYCIYFNNFQKKNNFGVLLLELEFELFSLLLQAVIAFVAVFILALNPFVHRAKN